MEKVKHVVVGLCTVIFLILAVVFVIAANIKLWIPAEPKITIATDPPTGCEYLIYGTIMTPRLLPNGDQVCGEAEDNP
jgi:hypothetical protein